MLKLFLVFTFTFSLNAAAPDLSSTPEFDLTDSYLVAKATELNNDPAKIYEFVRDEISFEAYEGSLRGARGALWSKAGNSLDQASLLVALLRISGFPARYAHGTLTQDKAKVLIGSMFDLPLQVVGCPAKGAVRADPANDPELVGLAQDHYWVEYKQGNSFVPLDASYAGLQSGLTQTVVVDTFNNVPTTLQHTVNISVRIEKNSAFGSTKKEVLNEKFITAELTGRPLSFGHFINTKSQGGLISVATTHKYTPYILVGDDLNIDNDDIREGTTYEEFLSSYLSIGNAYLQGVFLEIKTISPSGKVETFEKALVDRVGYAVRNNNASSSANVALGEPALTESDLLNINVIAGLQSPDAIERQKQRLAPMQALFDELKPQFDALPTETQLTDAQIEVATKASTLGRKIAIIGAETIGVMYNVGADEALRQLQFNYQVKAYFDSPRLLITKIAREGDDVNLSIDIRKNNIKVISTPEQTVDAPFYFEIARGYLVSELEDVILASFSGKKVVSAMRIFANIPDNLQLELITPDDPSRLLNVTASDEALARMSNALNNAKVVVAPESPIQVDGIERYAWLEIDQITGHTIAVGENGDHSAISYASLAKFSKEAGGFVGAFSGTFSGGLLGFTSGILEAAGQGLSAKAIIAAGKAQMEKTLKEIEKIYKRFEKKIKSVKIGFAIGSDLARAVVKHYDNIDPAVFPFLSTAHDFKHVQDITSSVADFDIDLKKNDLLFYPTLNPQFPELPSVYQLSIKNNGPNPETVDLNLTTASNFFDIRSSLDKVVIPAGETASVSVCLSPKDDNNIPDNIDIPFSVKVSGSSGIEKSVSKTVTATASSTLVMELDSPLSTLPATAVSTELHLSALGSDSIENINLTSILSPKLSLTGLPATFSLQAGEKRTIALNFTPDANSTGEDLSATITASYTVNAQQSEDSVVYSVKVRSVEALTIESCSTKTGEADNKQLSDVLSKISLLTAKVQQDPSNKSLCNLLAHKYHNLAQLAAVNPGWSDKLSEIQTLRDTVNDCKVDQFIPASQQFFTNNCFVQGGSSLSGSSVSILPSNVELESGTAVSTEFIVNLKNNTKTSVTYDLSLGNLPTNVSASLSQQTVTLGSGESLDKNSPTPLKIMLQSTIDPIKTFPVSLIVSPQNNPSNKITDTSLVTIRLSFADILKVNPTPAVLDNNQTTIDVSVQLLNTANKKRAALVKLEIINTSGDVVGNIPAIPVELPASTEAIDLNLGAIPVDSLTKGEYHLRATLQTASGQAFPGRSAEALLYKGAIISAEVSADPIIVAPGDSTVKTAIKITNLTTVSGLLDIKVKHSPNDSVFTLDESKTTPAPDNQSSNQINWSFSDPATVVLSLSGLVENMRSGEVRQISSGTEIIASFAAKPVAGTAVDLTNWIGNGPGNWVVQIGNDTVLQTENSNPSIFHNGRDSQGQKLSGKITVQADGNWDDDFIGFVLGYHDGDFNKDNVDYLLIDWKQGNQLGAKRGLSISHVTKSINGTNATTNGAWLHDAVKGVTELQRGINLGDIGWKDETTYNFDLVFTPTLVEVFVNGNKELSITGNFNNGAFGFYNNSQSYVLYSAISKATIPPPITTTVKLPPVVVAAKQLLSLAPAERTITAGNTTTYVLSVDNPLATEEIFNLQLIGLENATTDLPASITIPAGEKRDITVTVSTTDNLLDDYSFSVEATLASGNKSSVSGKLIVDARPIITIPTVALGTLAIDLQLSPVQVTAGQGTVGNYRLKLTNTGTETSTYHLTGAFPQGIAAKFARTEVTLLPGLSNFQYVDLSLTPDAGTQSGSYTFEVTATARQDSTVFTKQTAQLDVSKLGVSVDLVPRANSFELHVSNTGNTTESYSLSLTDPLALYATLATKEVTLAAGKTEKIGIKLLPVRLALPGKLMLTGSATAKSNTAITQHDTESLDIPVTHEVFASFSPAEQSVKAGDKTRFTLLVRNTGNKEDSYKAIITRKEGATAELIGLDGSVTQTIPSFRLPPFSTATLSLDAILADAIKKGEVEVDIISTTDSSVKARATATLKSLVNFNDEDQDGILDVNEFGGDPYLDQDGDKVPVYLDDNDNDSSVGDEDKKVSVGFDSDGDGIANFQDTDDDNDRILTREEGGSKDTDSDGIPDYLESNTRDTDGDHISDFRDDDDDGDGLSTLLESNGDINKAADLDGDRIPDYMDADDTVSNDSDNDGLTDLVECPTAPACIDSDGDDIPDYMDTDSDGDEKSDRDEIGSDPKYPLDSDADSIPDYLESSRRDLDGDGKVDQQDNDDDGDGIPSKNESSKDVDKDGILDYLDLGADSDGNGITDDKECPSPIDACPDRDGDLIPDYLDKDDDGDGKLDTLEIGQNPDSPLDSDGDGLPDYLEANHRDTDGDGKRDPEDSDDDGDGTPTKDEIASFAPGRFIDSDHDNIPDYLDPDTTKATPSGDPMGDGDSDSVLDSHEHPYRGLGPDSDFDGIPNYMDADDDNDGLPTLTETELPDDDSDGIPNYLERNDIDTDGDTLLNYVDPDDDGDGIPTSIERGKDFFYPSPAHLEGKSSAVHTAVKGGVGGSTPPWLHLLFILLLFRRVYLKKTHRGYST